MSETAETVNTEAQTQTGTTDTEVKSPSLFGPDTGDTDTSTDTDTNKDAAPRKYAGKYDSPDALEKGYKELESKFRSRAAPEAAPEKYELDEVLNSNNLVFADDDHRTSVEAALKEANVPQSMVAKLAPLAGDLTRRAVEANTAAIMQSVEKAYGSLLDPDQERATLQKEWGDDFDRRMQTAQAFAKNHLDESIWKRPLYGSAAGIKFLYELAARERGVDFIRDSHGSSTDSLEARKAELLADPAYFDSGSKKGEAMRKEVLEINKRLSRD